MFALIQICIVVHSVQMQQLNVWQFFILYKITKDLFYDLETLVTRGTLLNSKNHDLGDQNFIAAKGQLH